LFPRLDGMGKRPVWSEYDRANSLLSISVRKALFVLVFVGSCGGAVSRVDGAV